MHKLLYCSTQSGYSAQLGDGVISQQLDGGAPRYRRALKGSYHTASVQWVVKDEGYQYLMAFYRVWARNPSRRFLAKLCIDSPVVEDYQCYFSGSPRLTSKEAGVYTVTAEFRVKPLNTDPNLDNLIVNAGSEGVDLNDLTNPLETLVNESLPKAVGKL
ncbi:hypothetical protein B9T31_09455 [Acinetobacter sp. ANC 4558]|uniref:hypothetical protein n=1 Tax=Acinetobacter sp. ANC 4558 TaxID=1977876 RepID=UPI000A351DE3|nr:hypothetical protein [Acinetobacter sp. ANC 4558]OTG85812.1 hypothetical protein B9T31_09455 [Acinetobacter sp. ANC 4558]